jgi:hypothetical protein
VHLEDCAGTRREIKAALAWQQRLILLGFALVGLAIEGPQGWGIVVRLLGAIK